MVRAWRGVAAGASVATLGVALQSAAPLASTACDGHECDSHHSDYGCLVDDVSPSAACCDQGVMLDDDTWASTPQNASWLPFLSYDSITFHFGAWDRTRAPIQAFIWIAPAPPQGPEDPLPDVYPADAADGSLDQTTLASGNLGTVNSLAVGRAVIENATCSPAVVRLIVTLPDVPGGFPASKKGPCWRHQDRPTDAGAAGG